METNKCCICFYKIKKTQKKTLTCRFNHEFHQKCIWKWLVKHDTCPLCRENVSVYPSTNCEYNEYYHYIMALSQKFKETQLVP